MSIRISLSDAGVCTRLTTGPSIWIFPHFLPRTPPYPKLTPEPRLAFKYPNFTEGLRELIIGRFSRFVDDFDSIWRDRLVFTIFGISVDVSFDSSTVMIFFSGEESRIALAMALVRSEFEVFNKLFDAIECQEGLSVEGVFYPLSSLLSFLSYQRNLMLPSGAIHDIKAIAKYFGILPIQDDAPNKLQPSLHTKDVCDECDIFASYNRSDAEVVFAMVGALKAGGHDVWIDSTLVPGQVWLDEIERWLRKANSFLIFIGPSGLGKWQEAEARLCIGEFIQRKAKVIPVILPSCTDVSNIPLFLTMFS